MKQSIFLVFGFVMVGVGCVGIVTPLLPTTPFLLLAAYFFSRSSRRFHDWLLGHRTFGPLIRDWREHGAIPLRAKILALGFLLGSAAYVCQKESIPMLGRVAAAVACAGCAIFLGTRPTGRGRCFDPGGLR